MLGTEEVMTGDNIKQEDEIHSDKVVRIVAWMQALKF